MPFKKALENSAKKSCDLQKRNPKMSVVKMQGSMVLYRLNVNDDTQKADRLAERKMEE